MRRPNTSTFLLAALLGGIQLAGALDGPATWEKAFAHPPTSARPWVYWFWLNGNISSNGITADLEAMKRVGIGGVLIMEVDQGAPKGPADFGGSLWRALFKHVCAEAHRLGLEVNMNNDAGWCGSGGPWITPELAMQKLVWSQLSVEGPTRLETNAPQPAMAAGFYRDIALLAFPTPKGHARISNLDAKSALVPKPVPFLPLAPEVAQEETIPRERIVDLTPTMGTNGSFRWDVPAGKWTLLRFGHTPTGADNHPAPEPGRGLESDKLSAKATQVMFDGLMGKLISDSLPLAGNTLVSTHIDSWETGSQNWTPGFREEFRSRRGYHLLPFLPVMTGYIVQSRELSERFLWDVRQTVSDLLVQNYAGEFRRLAHQRGLRLSIEAYDGTPCDDMTYAGQADEPMAEFWSWGFDTAYSCVEMSSAAHTYGKRILGAEAFTANDQEKWLHHPATIKSLGDWAFCEGINRFVFHRYALQPWTDRRPGMSMGPWGLHYERTQTWWDQSRAWHDYLARCQYLLRQGQPVADICFLQPEGSPMRFTPTMPWRTGNTPERPRYNFDGCTPEVILRRMGVRNRKLVLPEGTSYAALVLPQVETMSPALLHKLEEFVQQGALVIGPAPTRAPGLTDYPGCDADVRQTSARLWPTRPAVPTAANESPNRILWDDAFMTPQHGADLRGRIESAKWIWHREGNPASAAPPGKRYFRRTFSLESTPVESARFFLTVDNTFELWVNGQSAGSGDNFKHVYDFDLKPLLRAGTNILAIAAENTLDYPNPAGAFGALRLKLENGSRFDLDTDSQWQTSTNPAVGWNSSLETAGSWNSAMELGSLGMEPWGELETFTGPAYVFPKFESITQLLGQQGLVPDFEADSRLRFNHRRDQEADIYFVANSSTNWLQAKCAFRVSSKFPECWDPMTGRVCPAAAFEEHNGRTFVSLVFEPSGSMFVLFREATPRTKLRPAGITSVACGERELLPAIGNAVPEPPIIELASENNHEVRLLTRLAGSYQVRSANGQFCPVVAPKLPGDLEILGNWDLELFTRQGTPKRVTLNALMDWSTQDDKDIKFFSGTATYRKEFAPLRDFLANNRRFFLDLGAVAVMARVTLNGHDLGISWKPPYRFDVTAFLKSGKNDLEIQVINLWVNRMVGDEQLPEDSDRNPDGTLKHWPQWLEADLPSPTGRSTFTSWRLWKKDSPLQPSGLLGPVRVISYDEVRIPRL
jgi:hypothetical protein